MKTSPEMQTFLYNQDSFLVLKGVHIIKVPLYIYNPGMCPYTEQVKCSTYICKDRGGDSFTTTWRRKQLKTSLSPNDLTDKSRIFKRHTQVHKEVIERHRKMH